MLRLFAQSQRECHRLRYERRITERGQIDPDQAIGKMIGEGMCEFECEPGFADAAGSSHREETHTMGLQEVVCLGDFLLASEQCRRWERKHP